MLFRTKKILLTLALSMLMSFQCSCDSKKENIEANAVYESDEDKEKLEKLRREYLLNEYYQFYDSYRLDYYCVSYLPLEEDIKNIISSKQTLKTCTFEFDYDLEKLQETIKNNSIKYQKTHSEYTSAFVEKNAKNDLLECQKFFQISLKNVLEEIVKHNTNNLNEDFHRMQSLKIFFGNTDWINESERYQVLMDSKDDSLTLAYYDKYENIIIISLDNIKYSTERDIRLDNSINEDEINILISNKLIENIYFVLAHEINHLRQSLCECRCDDETFNLSYSEYVMTLIEASAESELYNLDKNHSYRFNADSLDYIYYFERKDEALLMLLALTKNNSIEEYYNAIFDTNIDEFNKFFGLESENDLYRFYRILYVLDSLNFRTNFIFDKYFDDEIKSFNIKKTLGYAYRNEIFLMSLKNLMEYTYKNENMSLEDNLVLFNIIKNKIAYSAFVFENDKYIYDNSFVNQYMELETKYINFLGEYYKVSIEELREMEEHETEDYIRCLTNLANGNYISNYDYVEKSDNLLKKFPILDAILFADDIYINYYDDLKSYYDEILLIKKY